MASLCSRPTSLGSITLKGSSLDWMQREINGERVILPIWHGVSAAEVRDYSFPLADRPAARWEEGIETVAGKVFEVVRSELLQNAMREVAQLDLKSEKLPELLTGKQIVETLETAKKSVNALHIATAVTNGVEYLLTWNHKHLANAAMRASIERICRRNGFEPAILCTPEELLEE